MPPMSDDTSCHPTRESLLPPNVALGKQRTVRLGIRNSQLGTYASLFQKEERK